jgi:nucleotide-binding universal stress UspA family protein
LLSEKGGFSNLSSRGPRHACGIAGNTPPGVERANGAVLSVLHIVDNPFKKGWNLPTIAYEEEYRKELGRLQSELEGIIRMEREKGMTIREFVKGGEPKEEILKAIRNENADPAILLAHEEGRLKHFLYGGGTDSIIRNMPCSILLMREYIK